MRAGFGLALSILVLSLLPARAQETPATRETDAMFPRGVEWCWGRRYDAQHMQSHPGQTLSEFYLYNLFDPDPAKEEVETSADDARKSDLAASERTVSVLARFRDGKQFYRQVVACTDGEDGVYCNVECDGGSFGVKPAGKSLIVRVPSGDHGLRLEGTCDPDEEGRDRSLTGQGDGGIRIERMDKASCAAAKAGARPGFVGDPISLRERIASGGLRCLKRVYSAGHLTRHPDQKVAAFAIEFDGPATVTVEDGYPSTALDMTVGVKLRNGMTARRHFNCLADEYQWRCDDFRLRRRDKDSALVLAGRYGAGGAESDEVPKLAGLELGGDDLIFRLDTAGGSCSLE